MDYVNINEFDDDELATRMRNTNYEKYKSLVRMHLSFELELNTDEFDFVGHEIIYEDKGKLKKWNRLSKKHRIGHGTGSSVAAGCSAVLSSKSAGNSPTEGLQQQIDPGFLMHYQELKEFLMLEKNITQEGIFRKTGAVSRQNELRLQIQQDKPLDLERAGYSAHDCATVFKSFLAELPEPLLTDAHYPAHFQIAPLCLTAATPERQHHLLSSVQLLLLLLPEDHRELLHHIIEMLHEVCNRQRNNKMTADNLATVFTPHLICPRNLPPEVLHYTAKHMNGVIAYMISRGLDIFNVPAKVATDIRAYFLERKRKKTMSPEQTLDESISDISTVNTVYTFVDRAATAAATNTNTTDTELAQLYAHIQSLPESSKKRRLIKQFNKQNGQGTPLQFVVMNRLKNNEATRSAKSLGDSIKKHIFHKSLMSRTPKRPPPISIGIETPNQSNASKPAKLRVLFQSPNVSSNSSSVTCTPTSASTCRATATITSISLTTNPMHALHKSISSASLKLETASNSSGSNSGSNTSVNINACSVSAPVSRQQSHELAITTAAMAEHVQDDKVHSCCATPLRLMSAAAKQLIHVTDKKSVAWDEHRLFDIEEYSNPCTPVQQSTRYKSEPNLCSMLPQVQTGQDESETAPTPIAGASAAGVPSMGKSLTRKLMKGVSMGNLRFPFSTPETTKRLVRSVSATLKRRPSEDTNKHLTATAGSADAPLLEDVDDSDLDTEDEGNNINEDDVDGNEDTLSEPNCSSSELHTAQGYQRLLHSSSYRKMDLITSTPSLYIGRRSMSPITKSTQRMPKAMQESIMTPRSRKPVMVLGILGGNADINNQPQSSQQHELSFSEQDSLESRKEIEPPVLHSEDATSLGGYADILRRQDDCGLTPTRERTISSGNSTELVEPKAPDALSSDFKEYLLTRSVLTASPADLSFASRSDDFGGANTTQDIDEFSESELSPSLLYCLDGNEPATSGVAAAAIREDDCYSPSFALGSYNHIRKRAACGTGDTPIKTPPHKFNVSVDDTGNKENRMQVEEHLRTRKLVITSHEEYPGETAL